MAPFDLWASLGSVGGFLAYLTIGFTFEPPVKTAGRVAAERQT